MGTPSVVRFGGMADKGGKEPPKLRLERQRHDLPSAAYPAAEEVEEGTGK